MTQERTQQVSQEKKALSEIIEYVLDKNNPPLKVSETLNIIYDNKNIIMVLLERSDLYNIKRLFSISDIIFTHQEILKIKDKSGKDVLSYFIEYATHDLIDEFIKMLSEYSSVEDKKSILSSVDNNGKSHLIMMCENKKFENLEDTFKSFIDLIASSCGLNFLHQMLTKPDNNGNNILMAGLKSQNKKMVLKILDLISKTIIDQQDRLEIEYKLLTQINSKKENALILLSEMKADRSLQDGIIKLVKEIPSNWICLTQNDLEGHNVILLGIMNNNQKMIDNALSILATMDDDSKKIVLADMCRKFDSNYDTFKLSRYDIYINIFEQMEKIIGEELIVECLSENFVNNKDILHRALLGGNMEISLSLIKYLKLINSISDNDKRYIAELVMRKDNNNCSLISYAINKSNYEVCELILQSAKEFCDPITIKILINSKDSDGNPLYVAVRLNGDDRLAHLISEFANETGNQESIEEQIMEFETINQLQSSHIKPLLSQVFI